MNRKILCTTLATVLTAFAGVCFAADKDDVSAAVKKLADAPNYSWTTTVDGGFGRGPVNGKTDNQAGGYTTFTATLQEATNDIVMKGDKSVVKTDTGWQTLADLQKAADAAGGFSPETFLILTVQNFQLPAAQAREVTEKAANLKKTDDAGGGYTADLAADSAKQLITFRRPANADPNLPQVNVKEAKGTLKVWVKDGTLSKFQIHLTGIISFNDQDIDVDRTTTTEIKDVGTTKITIPDEAQKKLAAAGGGVTTAPATTRKAP